MYSQIMFCPQRPHVWHEANFFWGIGWIVHTWYCWWLKSCTTWDVWNPINNGINYQPQLVSRISGINSMAVLSKLKLTTRLDELQRSCETDIWCRTSRKLPSQKEIKFILQTQCFLPCYVSFREGIYRMFIYNIMYFGVVNDDEWLNLMCVLFWCLYIYNMYLYLYIYINIASKYICTKYYVLVAKVIPTLAGNPVENSLEVSQPAAYRARNVFLRGGKSGGGWVHPEKLEKIRSLFGW